MKKTGILFLLFVLFYSCEHFTEKDPRKVVVEYKGKRLYEEDLKKILPKTYTKQDSLNIVEPYIKSWLQKKVTVSTASSQISEEEVNDLDQQVIDYRDDLILNKFYNQKLNKLNENSISEQEMRKYYTENQRSFILNDNLVKMQFIIAPESDKDLILSNLENKESLKDICNKNKEMECYSGNEWMSYPMALQLIGLSSSQYPYERIANQPLVQTENNGKFYLVKWIEHLPQGETGPYDFYKNTIRSILINKRKLNLQKHIEDSLYNDAIQNNKIKFYE